MHKDLHPLDIRSAVDRRLSGLTPDPDLTRRIMANEKGEQPVVKKFSASMAFVTALIIITMASVLAAGLLHWNKGLEDELRITDDIKKTYRDTTLFDEPQISVTQGDVTMTLDQCIVDTHAAYISFRVKGYTPPEGMQPDFTSVKFTGHPSFGASYSFFDGLLTGKNGVAVHADGTPFDQDPRPVYVSKDGDMAYIFKFSSGRNGESFVGKNIRFEFKDLGFRADPTNKVDVAVPGVWAFDLTLKGTDKRVDLSGLSLQIGQSKSVITAITLSPIHISMDMNVPRNPLSEESGEAFPFFRGVRLKDGTMYDLLGDGGQNGYLNETGDACYQMWSLNRIIEPEQVDSLLFNGETEEAPLNEVSLVP